MLTIAEKTESFTLSFLMGQFLKSQSYLTKEKLFTGNIYLGNNKTSLLLTVAGEKIKQTIRLITGFGIVTYYYRRSFHKNYKSSFTLFSF